MNVHRIGVSSSAATVDSTLSSEKRHHRHIRFISCYSIFLSSTFVLLLLLLLLLFVVLHQTMGFFVCVKKCRHEITRHRSDMMLLLSFEWICVCE